MTFLLGLDIGSSSVKAALLDAETGGLICSAASPETEMPIAAPKPGWAEQDPELWWHHVQRAVGSIGSRYSKELKNVCAVGIAYQMHGLVIVDLAGNPIRPAIIWCDSRAVDTGSKLFREIGEERCLQKLLNSPGNFTASKLSWVKEFEQKFFEGTSKFMLPGDYIAFKLTGDIRTTPSGLSEGTLWDFESDDVAKFLLDAAGIPFDMVPDIVPNFGLQGRVRSDVAAALGLTADIPVAYRAGDQPNNAFSLGALEAGNVAATAGTSGVIYAVSGKPVTDRKQRLNAFVHVNHTQSDPRYGLLICINGAGAMNRWAKNDLFGGEIGYDEMNKMAAKSAPGSAGITVLPYGNGAERTLDNKVIGASIGGLQLNTHSRNDLARAVQEGIVFAMRYGLEAAESLIHKID